MAWTLVPKPTESSVTSSVIVLDQSAQPFGLLILITSVMGEGTQTTSITGTSVITGWTEISKPTASVGAWTNVAKPV